MLLVTLPPIIFVKGLIIYPRRQVDPASSVTSLTLHSDGQYKQAMAHSKTKPAKAPINRKRPDVIRFSVTPAERKQLRLAALKADLSMARYVRALTLRAMRQGLRVSEEP